jgi:Rrf2 family iron-sulfur cluster assembly transcriptional regulator
MKLSPNTRYAVRILFELGGSGGPVSLGALSESTGIRLRTVENVHAVLRRHQLTAATVGAGGGVQLLVPLERISLGLLVRLFEQGIEFAVCCGDKANDCPNQNSCEIRSAWRDISDRTLGLLDAVFLDRIFGLYPAGTFGGPPESGAAGA